MKQYIIYAASQVVELISKFVYKSIKYVKYE